LDVITDLGMVKRFPCGELEAPTAKTASN